MLSLLTWIYLINATLLILHEIDSAYWEEWKLFKLPGGLQGFLIIHVPLIALILYGLLEVNVNTSLGYIFSMIIGLGGIFAFSIHTYFIKKGNEQFNTKTSLALLYSILTSSIIQIYLTLTTWMYAK
jgi:hypothetical protein